MIGASATLAVLTFLTWNMTVEKTALDIETKAFQPYAVASAIAGPALQEPEELRLTRLWQAAMALRAVEKLEKDVQARGEPPWGPMFRQYQYRLERVRRLAQSLSIQATQDIVGSSAWPKPPLAEAAVSQDNANVALAALSPKDQACVRSVLPDMQPQQFAKLIRADTGTLQGVPILIRYGQEGEYGVALGVENEGVCLKLEEIQDRWSRLVYAPDLSMIVASKKISGPQGDDNSQTISVYQLNWYT
jgi:hypothetical protein